MRLIAVLISLFVLQGCGLGLLSPRESDPVIEDYLQNGLTRASQLGILSTTASRRTVIMAMNREGPGARNNHVCAEPPPDAADAVARTTAIEVANSLRPERGGSAEQRLAAGLGVATAVAPLLHRSQGLQLYRDGAYALCQDYMNGIVGPEDYMRMRLRLLEIAAGLIRDEIRILPQMQRSLVPGSISAPSAPNPVTGGASPRPAT